MLPHDRDRASSAGSAGGAPTRATARKLVDMANKARGRNPLKYEITIIPFFCGELPSGLDRLSFVWERGSKVFATEAEPVNPHTRACFWQQYLRQTVTVYQDGPGFGPKEYTLKVQAVRARGRGGGEDRRTVGRVKVDLAQFCNAEVEPLPREVFLQLKPVGKLKVSIKAGWLKGAAVDPDALTEASLHTLRSAEGGGGGSHGFGEGEDEQDLSGFEGADGHGGGHGHGHGHGSTVGRLGGGDGFSDAAAAGGRGRGAGAARLGSQQQLKGISLAAARGEGAGSVGSSGNGGSPRILAAAAGGGPRLPGEIPEFSPPLSPEEQREELERQKRRVMEAAEQHIAAMRRDMEDNLRTELELALAARSSSGWWRAVCCCWPRQQAYSRSGTNELAATGGAPASQPPHRADSGPLVFPSDRDLL
ncbi:MAG: hypothetical protein J3K34DRAFT_516111 [Monoraphidium minutum]|nr:MAG: hypothetical protein J3K34DRAFT_516111 [Monoraphidium minutum]